ncbi:hypothetical protein Tco_0153763 [Tanacetum coccineum]
MKKEKINITSINYSELNKLAKDFGKCFVPQQELSTDQMFWLQSSNKNSEEPSTSNTPVKIELKEFFQEFDKGLLDEITEVQTVFTQMEAAVEQCSVDMKCCEIQYKQFLIENDRMLDKIISQEIVNIVLNSSVIICDSEKNNENSVDTCNKCLELEAELKLNKEIFQKDKSSDNQNNPEIQEYFEQNDLKAQLQANDVVISKLKETIHSLRENANPAKVKKNIDEIETINIELEHSVAKLLSENEKLHKEKEHLKNTYKELYDSIKPSRVHAKEQSDSLIANLNSKSMENTDLKTQIQEKEIVESARALSPLDSNLDSDCKYVQRIQEVTVYIRDTCPCLIRPSKKLVAVTPKNKDKKVRFAGPVTSSSNTQKQVDSHKPKDSNQPLLHSIVVIGSTSASGSKPPDNTKNNKISHSSSSNKNNKVEDQSRSVKSRKNKKNLVAKTECNAYVMQSMLNVNSKFVCAICNECLLDANHDKYVLDYVHDVNVLSKSKPAKHNNKKQIWKPTGKVYAEIGYKWKPTGRTFTIVENKCPLTRLSKLFCDLDVIVSRVYYVEGLRHNLFSVGQFCDSDLEDTLLQPLFDEYFRPPPCVDHLIPEVAARVSAVSTGSPSSTSVDQYSPSPSTSQIPKESPSYVIPLGAEESSSQVVIPNNGNSVIQPPKHISK